MTARPILFSAPMVRALLEGRKTQTRRPCKAALVDDCELRDTDGWPLRDDDGAGEVRAGCPYGQPGDLLWVRETWRIGAWDETDGTVAIDYRAGNARRQWIEVPADRQGFNSIFRDLWQQSTDDAMAAGLEAEADDQFYWPPGQSPCRWRSPIHMPRWASRLTLRITDVRVRLLQDITGADAAAEGIQIPVNAAGTKALLDIGSPYSPGRYLTTAQAQHYDKPAWMRAHYASLWDTLNAKRDHPWAANPWVWAISFEVLA